MGAKEMAQGFKRVKCSCSGPEFGSLHPQWSAHTAVTPDPGSI